MWIVLGIIGVISLLVFWRGPNSVWGGITFGAIGGLIVAVVSALAGNGFHWSTIGKGIVVGALVGVVAELLGKVSDRMKKKRAEQAILITPPALPKTTQNRTLHAQKQETKPITLGSKKILIL